MSDKSHEFDKAMQEGRINVAPHVPHSEAQKRLQRIREYCESYIGFGNVEYGKRWARTILNIVEGKDPHPELNPASQETGNS